MNPPKLNLEYLIRPAKEGILKPKLMLLLHGYGSNKEDLFSFASELPETFCVISAQAPIHLPFGGYAWYDINFVKNEKFSDVPQAREAIAQIRKFISESTTAFGLNQEEIWLGGFSQGAILSTALALRDPKNIKRVLCLSGYPSTDIIGDLEEKDYSQLAFFVSHGTEDAVIPIEWARKIKDILTEKNIPFTYKEYRSGHGIVPQNFYDMLEWINTKM